MTLSIHLLGPPRILKDQKPLRVTRRKSRALVYYLAAREGPVARDHLLPIFWADLDRPSALQNLRTTLYGVRKALGAALEVSDETLALRAAVDVDALIFERRLKAPPESLSDLEATLGLYRGDFLADFSLPDSARYLNWVVTERERFRRLLVRGLTALSQQYGDRGDYRRALEALSRALTFNPLQEDLQREALRLHYQAGDRAGAIQRYDQLRKLLDEEMGVPPMKATRELYDAIITDRLPVAPSSPVPRRSDASGAIPPSREHPLPFIGRTRAISVLQGAISQNKLAVIEGEPGIGKTRLAEEYIRNTKTLALIGAGRELERSLPYQPMIEALRGLLEHPGWPSLRDRLDLAPVWMAEAARLLPELLEGRPRLRPVDQKAEESRLWEGLTRLLHALVKIRPVTLFLDDLHWADESTLALLGYLLRRSERAPISFLAATRDPVSRSPLASLLTALTREGRLTRVELSRLTDEEINLLAQRLSQSNATSLAEWLTKTSEGIPFVLAEAVRDLRNRGNLKPDGTLERQALPEAPLLPQTVHDTLKGRLATLSETARRVLDVAVAVGREFDFEVVERAAGLSDSAALDALDELQAAYLIYPVGGGLRFRFDHNLTMEVAYRDIGEPRHRRLHRRVAMALESLYRQRLDEFAGLLAWHFGEGKDWERAAPYAYQAGQQAFELAAWKEAAAFYEQALRGIDEIRRFDVLMALGQARFQGGDGVGAAEAFKLAVNQAEKHDDTGRAAEARLELARSFIPQARYAEVIQLARTVREEGEQEQVLQAEVLWGTALSIEGEDLAGAEEHLKRAEVVCTDCGTLETLAHIEFELGSVAAQQGDLPEAVRRYRQALSAAEQSASDAGSNREILAYNNLAYHLHLMGDAEAEAHAQKGLKLIEDRGALGLKPYLLSTLGEIALASGDLESAEESFSAGLRLAEQLVIPERVVGITANLGRVAQRRGQTALAIHRLSTALVQADGLGTRHLATRIRLWLAPLLPSEEGQATLKRASEFAERSGRMGLLEEVAELEERLQA
jgi:DNA-binding SARP family transcriptional activator